MASPVVLVIDDEPQIRRVVRNAVEPGMGAVLEAGTGREGIDMAAAERPQLVVLDLGLPDMDGAAVCREIRSWSSAPIIVTAVPYHLGHSARLADLISRDEMLDEEIGGSLGTLCFYLEIILGNPDNDVTVRMRGKVVANSIDGTWRVLVARTGGGGGHFVMVRHK